MYKLINAQITEEEHQWLKAQKQKDPRFKLRDFMSSAITVAINKAKKQQAK